MLARANMIRTFPPVIKEGSAKAFGLMSDSALSVQAVPKLRDIAQRIKIIQRVSQQRRRTSGFDKRKIMLRILLEINLARIT